MIYSILQSCYIVSETVCNKTNKLQINGLTLTWFCKQIQVAISVSGYFENKSPVFDGLIAYADFNIGKY